jgi:hypothetical protein
MFFGLKTHYRILKHSIQRKKFFPNNLKNGLLTPSAVNILASMSSGGYLYLALYRQTTHQYHWALVVSTWNVLNEPVEIFQIISNGGPWLNGYREHLHLMRSTTFVCCIPISPIHRDNLNSLRITLWGQAVEQGDTLLTPPYTSWSCEQWCMRTLHELIKLNHIADGFNTQHPRWKEVFSMNVILAADMASADREYGYHNGQVRVVHFIRNY